MVLPSGPEIWISQNKIFGGIFFTQNSQVITRSTWWGRNWAKLFIALEPYICFRQSLFQSSPSHQSCSYPLCPLSWVPCAWPDGMEALERVDFRNINRHRSSGCNRVGNAFEFELDLIWTSPFPSFHVVLWHSESRAEIPVAVPPLTRLGFVDTLRKSECHRKASSSIWTWIARFEQP